jgi:protein-tyrosine phosphatase
MNSGRVSVLFVCLGNICRSPLAEGVFRALVEEAGLDHRFVIDSAGTSGYHDGDRADSRTVAVAKRRGVRVDSVSRRVTDADLESFDIVLAMDEDNLARLEQLAGRRSIDAEIRMLREFDPDADGDQAVPDPYYGGPRGFENVHDIIERSCRALLKHLRSVHDL